MVDYMSETERKQSALICLLAKRRVNDRFALLRDEFDLSEYQPGITPQSGFCVFVMHPDENWCAPKNGITHYAEDETSLNRDWRYLLPAEITLAASFQR